MRQAYDYWQDQPDNYLLQPKRPPPLPRTTNKKGFGDCQRARMGFRSQPSFLNELKTNRQFLCRFVFGKYFEVATQLRPIEQTNGSIQTASLCLREKKQDCPRPRLYFATLSSLPGNHNAREAAFHSGRPTGPLQVNAQRCNVRLRCEFPTTAGQSSPHAPSRPSDTAMKQPVRQSQAHARTRPNQKRASSQNAF